jgi:hypothetical protein
MTISFSKDILHHGVNWTAASLWMVLILFLSGGGGGGSEMLLNFRLHGAFQIQIYQTLQQSLSIC